MADAPKEKKAMPTKEKKAPAPAAKKAEAAEPKKEKAAAAAKPADKAPETATPTTATTTTTTTTSTTQAPAATPAAVADKTKKVPRQPKTAATANAAASAAVAAATAATPAAATTAAAAPAAAPAVPISDVYIAGIELFGQRRQVLGLKDLAPESFIYAYAKHLKRQNKVKLPPYVDLCKLGVHKDLAPTNPDWYYIRAASVARKLYLQGGKGVGRFRRIYGGRKRRGSKPSITVRGSGAVIRHILHNLESIGVAEKDKSHGGRKLSLKGRHQMDAVSRTVIAAKPFGL
ncbi:40S ribosomal protein S19-3 [Pelomyxa schiedti]|nr:40S ribosomal protein S19-3 [Pelomyxa schiedti]